MFKLCRASNLTAFSPCLTGPVDYLFASRHKGPGFKAPGGYLCETRILLLALSRYKVFLRLRNPRLYIWGVKKVLSFSDRTRWRKFQGAFVALWKWKCWRVTQKGWNCWPYVALASFSLTLPGINFYENAFQISLQKLFLKALQLGYVPFLDPLDFNFFESICHQDKFILNTRFF